MRLNLYMDVNEIIEYMKQWDQKFFTLDNGWFIKEIGNHHLYEVINNNGNRTYSCDPIGELSDTLESIEREEVH